MVIDARELKFTFARSSGPGGQNVNKVNSKAILHWNVSSSASLSYEVKTRFLIKFKNKISVTGDFFISCDRFRDKNKNVQDCIERLEEYVSSVLIPEKERKETKPKPSQKRRRLHTKKKRSEKKIQRRRVHSEEP